MTVIVDITQLNGGVNGTVKGSDIYPAVDVTDQTQATTGTTKRYAISQLLDYTLSSLGIITYASCITASTGNLLSIYNNGTAGVNATLTNFGVKTQFSLNGVDGVVGGRYLIKNQVNQNENGIYVLSVKGSGTIDWVLTRSTDFNSSSNIINDGVVYVNIGTLDPNTLWQVTFTGPLVVGTTLLNWSQFNLVPDILFTWNIVTGTSQQIVNENGYIPKNVALTNFALPLAASVGQTFQVRGFAGSGGWQINNNANQRMYVANSSTSVGVLGYIASTLATDGFEAICIEDHLTWQIIPSGNITVV